MTHACVYLWRQYITQVLTREINVIFGRKLWALVVSHYVFIPYFSCIFHFGHWKRDVLIRCQTWPWVSAVEEMGLRCIHSANSPPFCFQSWDTAAQHLQISQPGLENWFVKCIQGGSDCLWWMNLLSSSSELWCSWLQKKLLL